MFEERIAAMNQRTEEAMAANAVQFDKRTYTVDEIQDILGISRTSAYNLVKKKVFHSVRIGGSIRISKRVLMSGWIIKCKIVKGVVQPGDKLQNILRVR